MTMEDTPEKPDCVDMVLEDGEFALDVPKAFFEVVNLMPGR